MSIYDYLGLFGKSFLLAYATILPIINPPAAAPIFWSMTTGATNQTRAMLAKRISINVFIMLVIATIAGNIVLDFFGISLAIVRVGGGVLVIASAWQLINAKDPDSIPTESISNNFSLEKAKASAFYPLTFPMTCGPGSISAAITIGASLKDENLSNSLLRLGGTIPGYLALAITIFLCLRFAATFLYRLGSSGTAVFMRLSAFILLCIGVQITWDGLSELITNLTTSLSTTLHLFNSYPR